MSTIREGLYVMQNVEGMSVAAFRKAMLATCRLSGINMTYAKFSIFINEKDELCSTVKITWDDDELSSVDIMAIMLATDHNLGVEL